MRLGPLSPKIACVRYISRGHDAVNLPAAYRNSGQLMAIDASFMCFHMHLWCRIIVPSQEPFYTLLKRLFHTRNHRTSRLSVGLRWIIPRRCSPGVWVAWKLPLRFGHLVFRHRRPYDQTTYRTYNVTKAGAQRFSHAHTYTHTQSSLFLSSPLRRHDIYGVVSAARPGLGTA
ncbi:hypothetical protein BD779DRAFT_286727 [Infundibulicybe gibba]|nr:hypothetical protein BD779DRAFT_286727 [Infundibulicybe gibba]